MINDGQLELIKKVACRYNNKGSAERFYIGEFTKSHRTSRLEKEFEFVKNLNLKNEIILDIGCSGGKYTNFLKNDNTVISIDSSIHALEYAKSKLSDASLIQASITHLPFKKEIFTTVLCIELLHHLDNEILDISVKEINQVILPDGNLICDLRNSLNPIMWYSYWKRDGISFPLKARSIFRFSSVFKKNGFRVISRKSMFFPISIFAPYVIFILKKTVTRKYV